MPPASAFRHPVSQSCTRSILVYRAGSPYSGTGLVPAAAFFSFRYRTDRMPVSSAKKRYLHHARPHYKQRTGIHPTSHCWWWKGIHPARPYCWRWEVIHQACPSCWWWKGIHPARPYCWRWKGRHPVCPYCWLWKGYTLHVHSALGGSCWCWWW